MKSLIYSLLPYWALRMIRRHRANQARLRINIQNHQPYDLGPDVL